MRLWGLNKIFHGGHYKASREVGDNYPPKAGFMEEYPPGVVMRLVNSTGFPYDVMAMNKEPFIPAKAGIHETL